MPTREADRFRSDAFSTRLCQARRGYAPFRRSPSLPPSQLMLLLLLLLPPPLLLPCLSLMSSTCTQMLR
jgi:hypothetical protein